MSAVAPRVASTRRAHSSTALQGIALALIACIVYVPALGNGFVWNDDSFLTENPLIHAADGLRRFWAGTEPPDYFPLTSTTLWLEWRVFGLHAAGYHAINVMLHAASCVLLWRVLTRVRVPAAWLAAAIFAVHPVNVESVAWITERKNTLSMLLYLVSVLAYLRFDETEASDRSRWRWYAGSLAAFALALTAKTSTVVLPVVLLGLVLWRRRRITRADLARVAPHFALAAAMGLVTVWFQTHRAITTHVVREDGLLSRAAIAGRAVWFYAWKALVPANLCFVYPRWPTGATTWSSFLPLLALVIAFAACSVFRASWGRACAFALGNYVIALLPALGFVGIYFMRYSLVSDHWQHIAMTVASASIAVLLVHVLRALSLERALPAVATVLLATYAVASWRLQAAYRDVESLWVDTLAKNPSAWIAHNNLGDELLASGRTAEAVTHFRAALEIVPDDVDIRANLAKALLQQRDFAAAATEYRTAIARAPDRAELHDNLGIALQGLQRIDEAIAEHREALRIDPRRAEAHNNLGNALTALGRDEEAIDAYRAALRERPDYALAHANLGAALARSGRINEAVQEYSAAVDRSPRNVALRLAFADLLCATSRFADAAAQLDAALAAAPGDRQVMQQVARLREQLDREGKPRGKAR
jgi:tetratricopeptide (TPR) repeat protein